MSLSAYNELLDTLNTQEEIFLVLIEKSLGKSYFIDLIQLGLNLIHLIDKGYALHYLRLNEYQDLKKRFVEYQVKLLDYIEVVLR